MSLPPTPRSGSESCRPATIWVALASFGASPPRRAVMRLCAAARPLHRRGRAGYSDATRRRAARQRLRESPKPEPRTLLTASGSRRSCPKRLRTRPSKAVLGPGGKEVEGER